MQNLTTESGVERDGMSRRRLLQVVGAGAVVGGLGLATGVAAAQTLEDLCEVGQLDVVIVLDQSGSMSLGSPTRMARAKAGATALVNALNVSPGGVNAGVVTFAGLGPGGDVPVFQALTGDAAAVNATISSIPNTPPNALTNIEAGVQAARGELTGTQSYTDDITVSGNNRAGVPRVMVLLSDGIPTRDNFPSDEPEDPATFPSFGGNDPSEEAEAAKSVDGIEIYTIGIDLVPDAVALLESMASEPTADHAFPNVDLAQIEATFEAIAEAICPTEVGIDIKPGSDPNAINCRAARGGLIPVAVLGSDTFDVGSLDASTLRFGSPSTVIGGGGATLAHADGHLDDVNGDGYLDLVGHFPAADAGFVAGDVEGVLVGQTTGGDLVAGVDAVKIVGKC